MSNLSVDGSSPLLIPPVPWAALRNWLDAAERASASVPPPTTTTTTTTTTRVAWGGPTTIPRAQLLALSHLARFVDDAPAVPHGDHVGKLMRRLSPPARSSEPRGREAVHVVKRRRLNSREPSSAVVATTTTTNTDTDTDPTTSLVPAADSSPASSSSRSRPSPLTPSSLTPASSIDYTQARRLGSVPVFAVADPVQVPFEGAFQLRWHCTCLLPWCGQTFPRTDVGKSPALFLNKKEAKQYAAMEALAYLDETGLVIDPAAMQLTAQTSSQLPLSRGIITVPPPVEAPIDSSKRPLETETEPEPEDAEQERWSTTSSSSSEPASSSSPSPLPPPPSSTRPSSHKSTGHHKNRSPLTHATPTTKNNHQKQKQQQPPLPTTRPHRTVTGSATAATAAATATAIAHPVSPSVTSAATAALAALPPPRSSPPLATAPSPTALLPSISAAEEQGRLFEAISRLAPRLGIAQPRYRLVQDAARPQFFSGRAEFSVASRVPDGVAVVENVLGKKQARIRIAEKVLVWMTAEEKRRMDLVRAAGR